MNKGRGMVFAAVAAAIGTSARGAVGGMGGLGSAVGAALIGAVAPSTTERGFSVHTPETMPEASRPANEFYVENFGFLPNLAAVMSDSPALLMSYFNTQQAIKEFSVLTPTEINVVQLAISRENECRYCAAGHTLVGKVYYQTPDDVMAAIIGEKAIEDAKLEALREFALSVYEDRGRVSDEQLRAFFDAGYTRQHALDVVASIAAKVMSNYTNQLAGTELDVQIEQFAPDFGG